MEIAAAPPRPLEVNLLRELEKQILSTSIGVSRRSRIMSGTQAAFSAAGPWGERESPAGRGWALRWRGPAAART